MGIIIKFSGMILLSILAFAGVYFLKITLIQTIPQKANITTMLQSMPNLALNWRFWIALICYGAALTVYLFLLHNDDVSKIFSMAVGINILLTVIGATLFLGDTLSIPRIAGLLFIIIGVYIINETR